MNRETIIAPATPKSRSAIGVIRISGPRAVEVLDATFKPVRGGRVLDFPPRRVIYGYLAFEEKILDEVMVVYFRSPFSYTGEDMVEIYCHGNPILMDEIVEVYKKMGLREAERGEFTLRAFLNGKMDLTQAEAVMSLISSSTRAGVEVALHQLQGGLRDTIEAIRTDFTDCLATLEAHINFPEDVEIADSCYLQALKASLAKIREKVVRMLSGAELYEGIEAGIKIAIVGYPNVGKSSLFNALLGYARSIVYDLKGTTRDVISETVFFSDLAVVFMDTAGILEEANGVDKIAVDRTREMIERSWGAILVLEAGRDLNQTEKDLLQYLIDSNKKVVVFVNKVDLFPGWEVELQWDCPVVVGSAYREEDVSRLVDVLNDLLDEIRGAKEEIFVLREFQREALKEVLTRIDRVLELIDSGELVEVIAEEIRLALLSLDRITGRCFDEEVLDKVFSEFCIGK